MSIHPNSLCFVLCKCTRLLSPGCTYGYFKALPQLTSFSPCTYSWLIYSYTHACFLCADIKHIKYIFVHSEGFMYICSGVHTRFIPHAYARVYIYTICIYTGVATCGLSTCTCRYGTRTHTEADTWPSIPCACTQICIQLALGVHTEERTHVASMRTCRRAQRFSVRAVSSRVPPPAHARTGPSPLPGRVAPARGAGDERLVEEEEEEGAEGAKRRAGALRGAGPPPPTSPRRAHVTPARRSAQGEPASRRRWLRAGTARAGPPGRRPRAPVVRPARPAGQPGVAGAPAGRTGGRGLGARPRSRPSPVPASGCIPPAAQPQPRVGLDAAWRGRRAGVPATLRLSPRRPAGLVAGPSDRWGGRAGGAHLSEWSAASWGLGSPRACFGPAGRSRTVSFARVGGLVPRWGLRSDGARAPRWGEPDGCDPLCPLCRGVGLWPLAASGSCWWPQGAFPFGEVT